MLTDTSMAKYLHVHTYVLIWIYAHMGGKYSQFRITQAVILVFIFRFSHRYVRMYARRIHFLHIYKQTCVHRITPTFGNVHSTYVCTYICTYLNMKKQNTKMQQHLHRSTYNSYKRYKYICIFIQTNKKNGGLGCARKIQFWLYGVVFCLYAYLYAHMYT